MTWITNKKWIGLRRHAGSGVFYLNTTVGQAKLCKSLQTTDPTEALIRRDQALVDARRRLQGGLSVQPTETAFGVFLGIFEADSLARLKAKENGDEAGLKASGYGYIMENIAALKRSWPELETTDVRTINQLSCRRWASDVRPRYSPTRFNGMLSILSRVFKLAVENRTIQANPADSVARARVKITAPTLPSMAEFHALIEKIRERGGNPSDGSRFRRAHDCADFVLFLAGTGLRVGVAKNWRAAGDNPEVKGEDTDAAGLLVGDVDLDYKWSAGFTGRIHVRQTKNGYERFIPVFQDVRPIVERWMAGKRPDEKLCPVKDCYDSVYRACEDLGWDFKLSHHKFRHLFITRAYIELGAPVKLVAKWVGHRDGGKLILTRYGHLRDEHERSETSRLAAGMLNPANVVQLPTAGPGLKSANSE